MTQVIYCITNTVNKKQYIGSTSNFSRRKKVHFDQLRDKIHHSKYLQRAFNKYGESAFQISVLENVPDKSQLLKREQFYIDSLNPVYNVCKVAGSSLGVKRSDEFKEKLRLANTGLKHPPERNKIKSLAQGGEKHWTKNKSFSKDTLEKKSNSMKGFYDRGGTIRKGLKATPETLQKMKKAASKPIEQLDLDGRFIKIWESAKQAGLSLNIKCSNITACLKNKVMTAGKFKWRYRSQIVIGCDFDETLVVNDPFPNITGFVKDAKYYLNKLYDEGYYIIIWTCRADLHAEQAKKFMKMHGIKYHQFNKHHPDLIEFYGNDSRKISADIYVDDKCLFGLPEWKEIYERIKSKKIIKPVLSVIKKPEDL